MGSVCTCVQLLEALVGEEGDACVGDDPQDGGDEAAVERPQALLLGDPHKHVQDVAVPVGGFGGQMLRSIQYDTLIYGLLETLRG